MLNGENLLKGDAWIGDYSRLSYSDAKNYVALLKEVGVAVLDDDFNFIQTAMLAQIRRMAATFIGNGSPDNGFLVVGTGANNNFTIKAGNILVDGWLINLAADTTYTGQPVAQANLTTPGADRSDQVYLDIWLSEVTDADDPAIVDPTLAFRTSCRLAINWAVKVAEGGAIPVSGIQAGNVYHWYYGIATINRTAAVAAINATMVNTAPRASTARGTNRNYLINGDFDYWYRGTNQITTMYGSDDRWGNCHQGSTMTHSQQTFAVGQTDVPDNPRYFSRTVVVSAAGANNGAYKAQAIESVRTFAGQKATLTFWAKSDAPRNMAVCLNQFFGTGGAPSASVVGIGATTCVLTTAWKKYTVTFNIPTIAGKTLGTNDNDTLQLDMWFDAGANYSARANNIGQQSGTFDIAHAKLEEGPAATPFSRAGGDIGGELARCQRYYETAIFAIMQGSAGSAIPLTHIPFHVQKRATPAISIKAYATGTPGKWTNQGNGTDMDNASANTGAPDQHSLRLGPSNSVSAGSFATCFWMADAELPLQ